jgi:hypothetical protein
MYRLVRRNDDGSAVYRCIDHTGSETLTVYADGSTYSHFLGGVCEDWRSRRWSSSAWVMTTRCGLCALSAIGLGLRYLSPLLLVRSPILQLTWRTCMYQNRNQYVECNQFRSLPDDGARTLRTSTAHRGVLGSL